MFCDFLKKIKYIMRPKDNQNIYATNMICISCILAYYVHIYLCFGLFIKFQKFDVALFLYLGLINKKGGISPGTDEILEAHYG